MTVVSTVSGSRRDEAPVGDAAFAFDGRTANGRQIHDPSVVEFDEVYVLVGTNPTEFVPIWTSTDLKNWDAFGPILGTPPEWLKRAVPQHRSIWAPAPLRVDDQLRIYYCASRTFGKNTSFIGLVENRSFDPRRPTDGWADRGMLIESHETTDDFNAIDPDAFIGPDGRNWLVYGSYWSGIYLEELDPVTGFQKVPGQAPIHVASNTQDDENAIEAAVLRYRDGYYYLFVTYGLAAQGVRSDYRMMVGRSSAPEGPYLGYDRKPMTVGGHTEVLKSSPPMFGPGGGNVFRDASGEWWMAYHFYDSRRHWHHDIWGLPTLQIRQMIWSPDGWPLPGLPVGAELDRLSASSMVGDWRFQVDFHDVQSLVLAKDGLGLLDGKQGCWSCENGFLSLSWPVHGSPQSLGQLLKLDESGQFGVGRDQRGAVVRIIRSGIR